VPIAGTPISYRPKTSYQRRKSSHRAGSSRRSPRIARMPSLQSVSALYFDKLLAQATLNPHSPPLIAAKPLLAADHVKLVYPGGLTAISDVSLEIPAGQFVSLLGPSGCGKSTFLRLIAGLLQPTAGQISVEGQSPDQARKQSSPMSFVFQDATLLPWRTVFDNVQLPLELLKEPDEDRKARVTGSLKLVGLADFADHFPAQLSGGMRMRTSLARALVTEPKILLLDEPFGALDDITRSQLNEDLLNLWQTSGWTSVFVTHNIAEAVFLSQRVIVMTPRPASVAADIVIPFAMPRTANLRASAEFARVTGQVSEALRRACT
jgi:NitT/TauT family transport system ATP-binding protein